MTYKVYLRVGSSWTIVVDATLKHKPLTDLLSQPTTVCWHLVNQSQHYPSPGALEVSHCDNHVSSHHHQSPLKEKHGSSKTHTLTSQTASTNWTDQNRLFCSGWELHTTDLMPTCTTSSRLASLRCAHATQTSWLQNTYCCTANYMMLWGGTCGQTRHYWGTSPMATWRSWGGQPLSWGRQASPSWVRRRRRRTDNTNVGGGERCPYLPLSMRSP